MEIVGFDWGIWDTASDGFFFFFYSVYQHWPRFSQGHVPIPLNT